MRIRSIKPQFFRDSKILNLPPLARLLFIGLWCCADREGRMEYDPGELRREVLPEETPKTTESLFAALAASGLTVRYSAQGREYLCIPNFLKHQIPHHREQPSTSPGQAQGEAIPKQVEGRSVMGMVRGTVMGAVSTTSATRPAQDADAKPAAMTFPVNGGDGTWTLTTAQVGEWSPLYPTLDVIAECSKALAWIRANNRKTSKGMPKFLVGWLNRANDAPRAMTLSVPSRQPGAYMEPPGARPKFDEVYARRYQEARTAGKSIDEAAAFASSAPND